jgi:hypothetical protein
LDNLGQENNQTEFVAQKDEEDDDNDIHEPGHLFLNSSKLGELKQDMQRLYHQIEVLTILKWRLLDYAFDV